MVVVLNFEDNDLDGEIPAELYHLADIVQLRLGGNKGLVGQLTGDIQGWENIEEFSVARTQVGGTLPSALFKLTTLASLDLAFASFSGTLSESFEALQDLLVISLNNNTFSGNIPAAFDIMTYLCTWDLTVMYEYLFCSFPNQWPCVFVDPSKATLEIHGNQLLGTISDALCSLRGDKDFELNTLSADCSSFDGSLPKVSCDCCTSCYAPP